MIIEVDDRATSENPRKRVKLEDRDRDEKSFQDHPTLYIEDGNVILRTGGTLFCVHKSLLSKHSPVFRELFQRDAERFRGLAHYTMEETREDLEVLLNVIYDGLHIDVKDFTVETFPTLATVLRMASKYKIGRPCQAIVARIRQQWPASLADHDALVAQARAPVAQQLGADDKGKARDAGPLNANMNTNPNPLADINAAAADYFRQQAMRPSASGPQLPASYARDGPIMLNPSRRRMAVPAHIQPLAPPPNMAQPVNYGAHFLPMGMGPPAAAQADRNGAAQDPIPGPSNATPAAPAVGPAPAQAPAAVAPAEKEDLIIHPASVIAVLRECGYSDAALFFPLFYALSRTTAQFGGGGLGYHLAPLSAADMERFVVGIERLRARHTALVVSTPSFDSVRTPGGAMHFCREGARELWAGLVYTLLVTNEQHAHEPVEEWQDMVAGVSACAECCKAIAGKIQTYREYILCRICRWTRDREQRSAEAAGSPVVWLGRGTSDAEARTGPLWAGENYRPR